MRRAALLGCLAAAALASLAPSGAAAGTIAEPVLGGGSSHRFAPELTVHASHGYRVTVSERKGAVALTVLRLHRGHSLTATSYVARGTADATGLRASFGRLGRISMRFRPAPVRRRAKKPRCDGIRSVRPGLFVGTLRFRGEGGYVAVRVHRVAGELTRISRHCARQALGVRPTNRSRPLIRSHSGLGAEIPYVAALSKTATGEENLIVLRTKKPLFLAWTNADSGRVSVFHVALAIGSADALTIDNHLDAAQVSGRPPFSGSAAYAAAPDGSSTWEGTLAVRFPGAPSLPLTGPPLQAGVGTIPPLLALFLLRTVKSGDAASLVSTTRPSLLAALGAKPR
jgi:hypothetical protein